MKGNQPAITPLIPKPCKQDLVLCCPSAVLWEKALLHDKESIFPIPSTPVYTWNLMGYLTCLLDQSNRMKGRFQVNIMKPKSSYFHCSWCTKCSVHPFAAFWTILHSLPFLCKCSKYKFSKFMLFSPRWWMKLKYKLKYKYAGCQKANLKNVTLERRKWYVQKQHFPGIGTILLLPLLATVFTVMLGKIPWYRFEKKLWYYLQLILSARSLVIEV